VSRVNLRPLGSLALPIARYLERSLPFVTHRLAAALRIRARYAPSVSTSVVDWWHRVLKLSFGLFSICLVLAALMQEMIWLMIGLLISAGFPILRYRSEMDKAELVRESITYDLPEFVQNVMIYLYAGLTVSRAISSIAGRWRERTEPLPLLLKEAAAQLACQAPLGQVLHQLAEKADTSDMRAVVTILLTHTIRGGDSTVQTLLDISNQLWSKRLALARKQAEETTVKLIFPLMLIFIAILLIVGAPAVMFVSG